MTQPAADVFLHQIQKFVDVGGINAQMSMEDMLKK